MEDKFVKINRKELKLTNLDKIYFPEDGYTKADVIEHYLSVYKYIIPYLKDRPHSLNRHPKGINGESFYHKDMPKTIPEWIKTVQVYSESNNKNINYFVVTDKASLIYMANLGCIEINPWFSDVDKIEYPEFAAIDLDPLDIGFDKVIEAAIATKEVLDKAGAPAYLKTSGSTGLHILVPLKKKYDYDTAKEFIHIIVQYVNEMLPNTTSIERMPVKRKKRVYLDYLQNRQGQTLAAPYSLRPKKGAPVATPLKWSELKKGLEPKQFNIKTIMKRINKVGGDIMKPSLSKGIDILKCLKNLERS
jgi:bifunctional non-homologous end joining protein LigD